MQFQGFLRPLFGDVCFRKAEKTIGILNNKMKLNLQNVHG